MSEAILSCEQIDSFVPTFEDNVHENATKSGCPLPQGADPTADGASLGLSSSEMQRIGQEVLAVIIRHFEGVDTMQLNPSPAVDSRTLAKLSVEQHGATFGTILETLTKDILSHYIPQHHRRVFGMVPCPHNFISVMAAALIAAFNPFGGMWRMSPGPTTVELTMLDWLKAKLGLPTKAGGLFVNGGSAGNLTALAVAVSHHLGEERHDGVAYMSVQTHPVIRRALKMLGIPLAQIRELPVDPDFKIDLDRLWSMIESDIRAGLKPFCIIANAGTTNTAAVDPLRELSELSHQFNLWLHIDGAYGVPAILTERGSQLLDGIELADSIALDPHKWLFQPYEIGAVLVKNKSLLAETFHLQAHYLKGLEMKMEEVNLKDHGLQLTRSLRAIKLWMSLKYYGEEAISNSIDHGIDLAEYAEKALRNRGCWHVVTPAQLAVVTFRYEVPHLDRNALNVLNRKLARAIIESGHATVNSTVLDSVTVLRMCTINHRSTTEDVDYVINLLENLAQGLV